MNRYEVSATIAPTAIIVGGTAVTAAFLPSENALDSLGFAAIGVGISLCIATAIDARAGVRGLIRVDVLMLWVLYGLLFLEFLFPQPGVEGIISAGAATTGTYAALLGFAALAVGRHLVPRRTGSQLVLPFAPGHMFVFFVLAALVGYLHILFAVNFDLIEMLRQMSLPRFSQSWARGRYGDIYSLLYEFGLLIYLLPPMGGLIFARKDEYSLGKKIVVSLVIAITFYYGFASGTRNVVVTYVIAFAGTYFLMKPDMKLGRMLIIGVPTLALLLAGTALMLEFRQRGVGSIFTQEDYHYDTLFIDHNLVNLSQLTQVFPDSLEFLGLEVPFQALIRPIPRAIWTEKPEGLTSSIEAALGAQPGTTLSCTFIGEAYMAYGFLGVLLAGLLFGAAAELWNRTGRNVNSSFSQVLYASGFLCAAMAMRSMLSMVPFMLPTLALWLYGKVWLPRPRLSHASTAARPDKY